MTRSRLKALAYPKEIVDDVSRLVFLHLRPHTLKLGWTDSAVRRYVRDAGHLLEKLNALVRADVTRYVRTTRRMSSAVTAARRSASVPSERKSPSAVS